ncbi:MAG: hypothetical protein ACJ75J_17565 [Cytophagaceae bacterium]
MIYFSVISGNIEKYRRKNEMESRLRQAQNAPATIKKLEKELSRLNTHFQYYLADSVRNHEYILEVVSNFCHKNNVILKNLPKVISTQEKNFKVESSIVVAEGNYINLLKLLHELEQVSKIGRVSSVVFKSHLDSKTKRTMLTLTIYLQNIVIPPSDSHES